MQKEKVKTTVASEKKLNENLEAKKEKILEKGKEVWEKVKDFEVKADKEVDKIVKKIWFADKVIKASWVQEILSLSFIEKANAWIRKNLETICKVLWILWVVYGVIFSFVPKFSVISLIMAILIIILSRWLMKMKKWYPATSIVMITLAIILMFIAIFTKLSFTSYLLFVLLSFVLELFVLKNKDLFKN